MINNNDDAHFLDLLQKWQSGDFTRRDEQELKALTADDDFRREAWEGFVAHPEAAHQATLATLRSRLRDQDGRSGGRRIGMVPIWAAAAAIVVLIGAVLFFQQKNDLAEQAPLATNTTTPAEPSIQSAPAENSPSGDNNAIVLSDQSSPKLDKIPADRNQHNWARTDDDASHIVTSDLAQPAPASAGKAAQPYAVESKSEEALDLHEAEKDQVVAAAESVKKKAPAATKPLPTTPSGRATADTAWNQNRIPPDMAKRRKQVRDDKQPLESEPADGWDAFQEYLRQNARLTPAARNNNVSGTVRLQFTVNANGDTQAFITLRSIGYGCDEEAIRLVREWEWVRGRNATVVLDVPFVR